MTHSGKCTSCGLRLEVKQASFVNNEGEKPWLIMRHKRPPAQNGESQGKGFCLGGVVEGSVTVDIKEGGWREPPELQPLRCSTSSFCYDVRFAV